MSLKIAVIGAGSTYTPELIEGFIKRKSELAVASFYLMDIDKEKLDIVGNLAIRMLNAGGLKCRCILTEDLKTAIEGADFVIAQIRVGKLDARIKDEKIPLKYDLIGQETTGIGGFMKGMRTIPAILKIAGLMKKHCPDAWLINFSNPSGLIAEAVLNYLDIKMLGLCNAPINMKRWIMDRVPANSAEVTIDYVGLNHLSWITGVFADGKDLLPSFLNEKDEFMQLKNIPDIGWEEDLLKAVKGLPNSYLLYYYYRDRQLKHLKEEQKCRGEVCKEIELELLQLYKDPNVREKPAVLEKRGGALYSEAAVSLISAIYNNKNETHIVNTKNQGVLDFMDYNDVIEIGCNVNRQGAQPIPLKGRVNDHVKGMMQTVKKYEKHAAEAGITGNYHEALNAMLIHPLVGDFTKAKACLDELMETHREYLPQFFNK